MVYITQSHTRRLPGGGSFTYDFSDAERFGETRILTEHQGARISREVTEEVRRGLADFGPEDYLLLVGNPCLIGIATAVAAERSGGVIQLLQWNRNTSAYWCTRVNLSQRMR